MKTRSFFHDGWRVVHLMAICLGLVLAKPFTVHAASGVVALPPSPVPLPPKPSAPADGDWEGLGIAGSSRFIVIGRPGREVSLGGTNVDGAGQVIVWELEEGYFVDDVVKKRFWEINALNPKTAFYFGGAVAAGDRWIAVAHGQSRTGVPTFANGAQIGTRTNRVQLIEFPPGGGWLPGPDLPGPADSSYRQSSSGFGGSLAMHRNRLVVGSNLGALVYEVSANGVWTRTQILNTNSTEWLGFGQTVAIYDDLIAVGASGSPQIETNGLKQGQGGAIIYRRGPNGLYAPEKELRAVGGNTSDGFGYSLALEIRNNVEWLAVGAPGKDAQIAENSYQPNAGSVHLYHRNVPDGQWTFDREITNYFGSLSQQASSGIGVALSNGRLAVSAISSGGSPSSNPGGRVAFYYHDDEQGIWVRTGDQGGSGGLYSRYGLGLHGFEHGFLIGSPGYQLTYGDWEWRTTDPYVGFVNQAPGPFVAGTPAHDRRKDVDPDGDGLINADELFFGTPPLSANTNRIFTPTNDVVAKQFKLQWQQATATFGLKASVAWSSNMTTGAWTTNGVQIVDLGAIPGSTNRRYEAKLSTVGRTNVFFRLLVE